MAKQKFFKESKKETNSLNIKKLIPIVIAIILAIIAIILFFNNKNKSNISYSTLIVDYQGKKNEYKELKDLKTIEINDNYSIRLAAYEKGRVILVSDSVVTVNKNEIKANKEIEIYGEKQYIICITSDDCFEVRLSR